MTNGMRVLQWLAGVSLVVLVAGCEPDEVHNSSNEAVVMAQFFVSRTNRIPVSGVRMVVESPGQQESDRPYNGPDVVSISGDDGIAVARVFPGFTERQPQDGTGNGSGTGGQQDGPQNPLDLPPPLFFADVAVTLIYQGRIVPFIEAGLTVGSGRLYDLGSVFLDELGFAFD